MSRRLIYLNQAKRDLIAIKKYISDNAGDKTADKFITEIRKKCRLISETFGTIGRDRSELIEGVRSLSLGNYIIFFQYSDGIVEIITIIEGHRDIDALFEDNFFD